MTDDQIYDFKVQTRHIDENDTWEVRALFEDLADKKTAEVLSEKLSSYLEGRETHVGYDNETDTYAVMALFTDVPDQKTADELTKKLSSHIAQDGWHSRIH